MKPLIVLLGVLGLGGFSWASWNFLHQGIAHSLTSQAQQVLDETGANASVTFDHLDGVVRGVAEGERDDVRRAIEEKIPAGRIVFVNEDANELAATSGSREDDTQQGIRDLALTDTPTSGTSGITEAVTGAGALTTGLATHAATELAEANIGFDKSKQQDEFSGSNDFVDFDTTGDAGFETTDATSTVSDPVTVTGPASGDSLVGNTIAEVPTEPASTLNAPNVDSANLADNADTFKPRPLNGPDTATTSDLAATANDFGSIGADNQIESGSVARPHDVPQTEVTEIEGVASPLISSQEPSVDAGAVAAAVDVPNLNGEAAGGISPILPSGDPGAVSRELLPNTTSSNEAALATETEPFNVVADPDENLTLGQPDKVTDPLTGPATTSIGEASEVANNSLSGGTNLESEKGLVNVRDASDESSNALDGNPVAAEPANAPPNLLDGRLYSESQTITSAATNDLNGTSSPASGANAEVKPLNAKRIPPRLGIYMSARQRNSYVRRVEAGSAAAEAGVRVGDRVTSFGGMKVGQFSELVTAVKKYSAGEQVDIVIDRNGQVLVRRATLKAAPATPPKTIVVPKN